MIDPPIYGNAFRVITDLKHKQGLHTQGRFELWADKAEADWKPEELKPEPKRALMDMKSVFSASSYYNKPWSNPRLDSRHGIHSKSPTGAEWWQVDVPGSEVYEVSKMTLLKRADGTRDRIIHYVQF